MKRFLCSIVGITLLLVVFLPAAGRCDTYEAYTPWSGHWWPFWKGELVNGFYPRGEPAPFAKYDYVTAGTYEGSAMTYGSAHYYNSGALAWEGMCFQWAAASIREEEPLHKGIYRGTVFSVGDKKGLLTAAYDGVSRLTYLIEDPLVFHQVLDQIVRGEGTPVIMDLGTDGEVWNFPVFKYDITTRLEDTRRHYTVTLYLADDDLYPDSPDYVGTKVSTRGPFYYWFEMDGNEVTDRGWENGNEDNHPLRAYTTYGTGNGHNHLDYETVREIADANGDPYEGNSTAEEAADLWSGHYSLVAIGTDWFKVALKAGDQLEMDMVADIEGAIAGDGGFTVRFYSPGMNPAGEFAVEERGDGSFVVEATETGDFFIAIEPDEPAKEPVYELSLQRVFPWQGIFPVKWAGLWYTGAALCDPDRNGGRVELTLIGGGGVPRISYYEPSVSHLLGITEIAFGLSASENGYLRVGADFPLKGLHAIRHVRDPRMEGSDIIPIEKAVGDLYFPSLVGDGGWSGWVTRAGIINTGDQPAEVTRLFYGAEGEIVAEDTVDLGSGARRVDDTNDIAPGALSMSAHTTSGTDCLVGYLEYWDHVLFQYRSAALVPAPLERGTLLIVPHIASGIEWPGHGCWRTDISVMNTGDSDTEVTCTAYDAAGDEIAVVVRTLKPNQRFEEEAADIFLQVPAEEIASVRISSDGEPLCGMLLFRLEDGYQSSGVPLSGPGGNTTLYLPHVACVDSWHTGVALMNTSAFNQTTVTFSLMDAGGTVLAETDRTLEPNQRVAATVKELFGSDFSSQGRYLSARSQSPFGGEPLSGLYLMTTGDGLWMNGGVLE